MSDEKQWAFPESLRPKADALAFDLECALDAMVLLRTEVPDEAFTAGILGTERSGYGVVIDANGLVLTIGYLVTEARSIWLTTNRGRTVPATVIAYDQATGFGLVQALARLDLVPLPRGTASALQKDDNVTVLGHGGLAHALAAQVVARREFAGYWEYVLDEAVFTSPAHPQWGGTALVDEGGRLAGVGSLLVQEEGGGETRQVNMFVPIDLLEPILPALLTTGSNGLPPRPWLGVYVQEAEGRLVVGGVAEGGPAARAGVKAGDLVLGVADQRVRGLAVMFRKVWSLGAAGVEVPLSLARDGDVLRVSVRSVDRADLLWKPRLH